MGFAMKELIILGTGVHGLEMAEIVERINRVERQWNLLGYIAEERRAEGVGQVLNGYPVLGTAARIADFPEASFVPCNEFHDAIEVAAERFVSIVDPSAFVSRTARMGRGCVIYPSCFVGLNASLGDLVFMLSGAIVNHDDVLEDKVVLCSNVTLAGFVTVEAECYLGQGCNVRQHLRIGRGSLIGMGSVVIEDVLPNSVMIGNPARKLRDRNEKIR
jgi:sugar O-acyltransferase (sialic acid O-acetyltransferase NeuD family)